MSLFFVRHEKENSGMIIEADGSREAMATARDVGIGEGHLKINLLVLGESDTESSPDGTVLHVRGLREVSRTD